jgi:hypothetical protein
MLPLGCLPLWGREGATLPAAREEIRNHEKKGFRMSQNSLCAESTKNCHLERKIEQQYRNKSPRSPSSRIPVGTGFTNHMNPEELQAQFPYLQ